MPWPGRMLRGSAGFGGGLDLLATLSARRAAWPMHVLTDNGVVRPQRRTETRAMRHRPMFALPPDDTNKIASLAEYMEALQR